MRPPRPGVPFAGRVAIAVVAALVLWGGIALAVAVHQDAHGYPGEGDADRRLPPAGSEVDTFDGTGPLRAPSAFGSWDVGGSWRVVGGSAVPLGRGPHTAIVDPHLDAVLVHAYLSAAPSGTGVVLRRDAAGNQVSVVAGDGSSGWSIVLHQDGHDDVLDQFPGHHADVALRVTVRRGRLIARVDDDGRTVDLPAALHGTGVGMTATDPTARVDELAYLGLSP